jgi:aspartyl-tRNA(Asn)/glutamyl-tRNA(Gln) amidotransferase subunit B
MPNLPNDLFEKFTSKYGLSNYDALVIIEQKEIAFYYESILEFTKNYKGATNWLMGSIKSYLNQKAVEITNFPIKAENIGILINMIDDGIITHSLASQKLFPEMLKYPLENPNSIAEKNQWINQQNKNNLEFLIKEILDKNPEEKERFKNGEKKLTGFFIGKIMKASNGTADPKKINQLLNQLKK